jgi:hypothetical protein
MPAAQDRSKLGVVEGFARGLSQYKSEERRRYDRLAKSVYTENKKMEQAESVALRLCFLRLIVGAHHDTRPLRRRSGANKMQPRKQNAPLSASSVYS